jgi:glycosyltransferase involved in cell wall biosynthesis
LSQFSSNSSIRSGLSLHGFSIDLRDHTHQKVHFDFDSYPSISKLFQQNADEELYETFLHAALDGHIRKSNDLYLFIRSLLRSRKRDDAIEVMNANQDVVYSNRKIIYEYIVLSSKLGNYPAMTHAIDFLHETFGINGIHSKVLQALIHARFSNDYIQSYIEKMNERYNQDAPYEILRAAFNATDWELALSYVGKLPSTPRNDYLSLRTCYRTGEKEKARKLIEQMIPQKYNHAQILEVIRIGLQIHDASGMDSWFKHSELSEEDMQIELARSQYKNSISELDFDNSFTAFKTLFKIETFTPHQVLMLVRTSNGSPEIPLKRIYKFGQNDPFLLSCVVELSTKYNFKDLAYLAFKRLEAMTLCSDRHSDVFKHYVRAATSSADLNLLSSVYENLSCQAFKGDQLFEFANYFDNIIHYLGEPDDSVYKNETELLEGQLLSVILAEYLPYSTYTAVENHALIVNNSLKFGGAERQVVRCLSTDLFTKNVVVWNSTVNISANSFIDEVRALDLEIIDYSIPKTPSPLVYTGDIEHILSLIPKTSPLNPGMMNKIRNLVGILREERPASLHLWQDTTNVLGAIAGLIAGVPRIVMSARSLPPFAIEGSTFPDKGPNYYLNNRYVRVMYKQLLSRPNVFLCHNSENGLEKYTEWLGGFDNKMLLLRNGFDFETSTSIRRIKKKTKLVGVVFRFVEVKRPLLWLKVASLVNQIMDEQINFQMIGDGPMLETAIGFANDLGISDLVEFSGYRDDVKDLVPYFDTFLLTSSIEGLPNVLIEAQSMGVPVVSTNAGGANETFIDSVTGLLVQSSEPEIIAGAVCRVLRDRGFKDSAETKGREFVLERFGIDAMHKQLHHILFEEL